MIRIHNKNFFKNPIIFLNLKVLRFGISFNYNNNNNNNSDNNHKIHASQNNIERDKNKYFMMFQIINFLKKYFIPLSTTDSKYSFI